jgi:hypothetical protein
MSKREKRYVEQRGEDIVGSIGARRIPPDKIEWIASEAKRTGRTQRALIEDIIESFLKHRKGLKDRFSYTVLPKHTGKIFRVFLRADLLYDALEAIEEDGICNGDFINAAIDYEIAKGCR